MRGVTAGRGRSAFQDGFHPGWLVWGWSGSGRGGPAVAPGRRRRAGGGGEEQPPCTSPSPLALQQPDFPEMMGRHRPIGALTALQEAGPGLGWGNPAKCLDFSPAPLPRQSAPLLRRGRTCAQAGLCRGQREPCQAKASLAQRPLDPGILCLPAAPSRNCAPSADAAAPAVPGPSGAAAGSRPLRR